MYPNNYDPLAIIQQALTMQPSPAGGQPMPTMTGGQPYYGPTHQALSDAFSNYLTQQAQGGLLAPPSPGDMGLLSPQIRPAGAVPMQRNDNPALRPNQYFRLDENYWDSTTTEDGEIPEVSHQYQVRRAPTNPPPASSANMTSGDLISAMVYNQNALRSGQPLVPANMQMQRGLMAYPDLMPVMTPRRAFSSSATRGRDTGGDIYFMPVNRSGGSDRS